MNTWEKAVSIREKRSRACKEHGEKCDCCEGNFKKGMYMSKNEKSSLIARLEIVNKQINELEKTEYNFEEVGKLHEKYNLIKKLPEK